MDRLIYLLTDGDVDLVKEHMQAFQNEGSMKASDDLLKKV